MSQGRHSDLTNLYGMVERLVRSDIRMIELVRQLETRVSHLENVVVAMYDEAQNNAAAARELEPEPEPDPQSMSIVSHETRVSRPRLRQLDEDEEFALAQTFDPQTYNSHLMNLLTNTTLVYESGTADVCAICLNQCRGLVRRINVCNHSYCSDCIERWALRGNATCPLCRANFSFR